MSSRVLAIAESCQSLLVTHNTLFYRIFPFKYRDCVDDVDCCLTSLYLGIRLDLHVQMYAGF